MKIRCYAASIPTNVDVIGLTELCARAGPRTPCSLVTIYTIIQKWRTLHHIQRIKFIISRKTKQVVIKCRLYIAGSHAQSPIHQTHASEIQTATFF